MTEPAAADCIRLGIVRPDRPHRAIADAEARVLQAEIDRRLGATVLDLRVTGPDLGHWRSLDHAAWPADVDAVVAADRLWRDDLPPLTALFARTVDPAAADVRRRMLAHLGVLPVGRLDESAVASLLAGPIRPTDLWLVVSEAGEVDVGDRHVAGFAGTPEARATLDDALDRLVADLPVPADDSLLARLQRCEAAARDARRLAAEHAAELLRVQREAADLLTEANERLAIAEERAERAGLGSEPPSAPPSRPTAAS